MKTPATNAPLLQMTPARRAAVIIAFLGEGNTQPVLERLDPISLRRVEEALTELSLLPRDLAIEVVMDFVTRLRGSSGEFMGGSSVARGTIERILSDYEAANAGDAVPEMVEDDTGAKKQTVAERMAERSPDQIADYLGVLTPNLIARILRKLPTNITSEVLARLPEDKLQPVLGNLVHAPEDDASMDSILETMIEAEFLSGKTEDNGEDDAHLASVGEILSLIPSGKRDALFQFLEREHTAQMEGIQQSMLTIDALPEILPREFVPIIFREIDMAKMVETLSVMQRTDKEVVDFLLSNLSSRMADQYRDEIERVEKPDEEKSDEILKNFVSDLLLMKRNNKLTINPKPKAA